MTESSEHKLSTPLAVQFLRIVRSSTLYGGVAQLGEHLPCKQGVKGSIPFISTKDEHESMATEEYRSVAQVVRARA